MPASSTSSSSSSPSSKPNPRAAASSHRRPPSRILRRLCAAQMGQAPSASPGGPGGGRGNLRWAAAALRLDLGFRRLGHLLGQKRRSEEQVKLNPIRWARCFWSPAALPAPEDEAEAEAKAEGKAAGAGAGEEDELGSSEADHLVVMVNGLYGSSEDWKFAAEQLVKRLPDKVFVHRSKCNHSKLTYDGVDIMGERLAEEVRSIVHRRRNLRKISFVAHSLGGLVSRYAIGRLYEQLIREESFPKNENHPDEEKRHEGTIAGLEPMNFITSATPHLGSRWNKQLPFLFGVPILEQAAAGTAHFIVGRTGKHLFLADRDDGRPPLLLRMVDDCDDGKFMSALCSFKRRVAYANVTYDHIVGWRTSSIRRRHELPKLRLTANDKKYPHVVNVDDGNTKDHQREESAKVSPADNPEEMMIRGLTQVTWERVDVCFQRSWLRYNAHNNIQVRIYPANSDGEDVIFHMVDNFLV